MQAASPTRKGEATLSIAVLAPNAADAGTAPVSCVAEQDGETVLLGYIHRVTITTGSGTGNTIATETQLYKIRFKVGDQYIDGGNLVINGFMLRAISRGRVGKDVTLDAGIVTNTVAVQVNRGCFVIPWPHKKGQQLCMEISAFGDNEVPATQVNTLCSWKFRMHALSNGKSKGTARFIGSVHRNVIAANQASHDYMTLDQPKDGDQCQRFMVGVYLGATESVDSVDISATGHPCDDMDRGEIESRNTKRSGVAYAVGYITMELEPHPCKSVDRIGFTNNATVTAAIPQVLSVGYVPAAA